MKYISSVAAVFLKTIDISFAEIFHLSEYCPIGFVVNVIHIPAVQKKLKIGWSDKVFLDTAYIQWCSVFNVSLCILYDLWK